MRLYTNNESYPSPGNILLDPGQGGKEDFIWYENIPDNEFPVPFTIVIDFGNMTNLINPPYYSTLKSGSITIDNRNVDCGDLSYTVQVK